jgi:hypothetical protein
MAGEHRDLLTWHVEPKSGLGPDAGGCIIILAFAHSDDAFSMFAQRMWLERCSLSKVVTRSVQRPDVSSQ